jgi:hypothetical protein
VATSAIAWPTRRPTGSKGPGTARNQVQRTDDLLAQPHRQGLHGGEPGILGGNREPRPAPRFRGQVGGADGLAGPEAVQAGPLVVLQLEQLNQPDGFAGSSHHPQLPARVSQQQPGGGHVKQLHATAGQQVQEVDHVEAGHHRVGQLNKRCRQQFSVHLGSLSGQDDINAGYVAVRTLAVAPRRCRDRIGYQQSVAAQLVDNRIRQSRYRRM